MIKLGQQVRCQISGFEGVAVGRADWLTGSARVAVQPRVDKDGKFLEMQWFNERQLEVVAGRKPAPGAANDTGASAASTAGQASDPPAPSD